jgi:hypothetical protein
VSRSATPFPLAFFASTFDNHPSFFRIAPAWPLDESRPLPDICSLQDITNDDAPRVGGKALSLAVMAWAGLLSAGTPRSGSLTDTVASRRVGNAELSVNRPCGRIGDLPMSRDRRPFSIRRVLPDGVIRTLPHQHAPMPAKMADQFAPAHGTTIPAGTT